MLEFACARANKEKVLDHVLCRREMSGYYLEHASVAHLQKHFDLFEEEARSLLDLELAIPAYVLHIFMSFVFYIVCCPESFSQFLFPINILLYNMLGMISF